MPYQYNIGPSQKIYLDNSGNATLITLTSGGSGQQQQSGTQFATGGPWTEVPQVARVGSGLLVRCVTAQGVFIWQVQGTQISAAAAAVWPADQAVPMEVADSAVPPMAPMAPMPPMEMGNMQMSANPMTMRMGNMTLGMDSASPSDSRKFCTQCGAAIAEADRFCGSCGHRLQ